MREIRPYGSEGGGTESNRSFLPLSPSSARSRSWMKPPSAGPEPFHGALLPEGLPELPHGRRFNREGTRDVHCCAAFDAPSSSARACKAAL